MRIVCAWCSASMGEKPPLDDQSETHSICQSCRQKTFDGLASDEERRQKHAVEISSSRFPSHVHVRRRDRAA